MGRILYAVMGNGMGHTMRTRAIVNGMRGHEFHMIAGGRAADVLEEHYPVLRVPVIYTAYKNGRVSASGTTARIVARALDYPQTRRRIVRLIRDWNPDLILADREIFTPHAAKSIGRSCVAVDHSRILKLLGSMCPLGRGKTRFLALLHDYLLYDTTRHNIIVSFFNPPGLHQRKGFVNEIFPSVIREEARIIAPSRGEHVFVYQSAALYESAALYDGITESLRRLRRPVRAYGLTDHDRREGNIEFRAFHPTRALEDLASCAYAVLNAGHNALCEAFYFGKPVFCFPIQGLYEQLTNAWFVQRMDYGNFSLNSNPSADIFLTFEKSLDRHREKIAAGFRDSTGEVRARIHALATRS